MYVFYYYCSTYIVTPLVLSGSALFPFGWFQELRPTANRCWLLSQSSGANYLPTNLVLYLGGRPCPSRARRSASRKGAKTARAPPPSEDHSPGDFEAFDGQRPGAVHLVRISWDVARPLPARAPLPPLCEVGREVRWSGEVSET